MPPRRRLGPGGAANPNPGGNSARAQAGGVNPFRNRQEEQDIYGASAPLNSVTPNIEGIQRRPDASYSLAQVRDYIDRSEEKLGPRKSEALRRAFSGDDSLLLTERPTNTSRPSRPRTLAAGWDYKSKTLFVRFRGPHVAGHQYRDGVGYEYYGVTRTDWKKFRETQSPGRLINASLNNKPYTPAAW